MKHLLLLYVLCYLQGSISIAQVQKIEDFRAYYKPDPEVYLKNFIPPGFTHIHHLDAVPVIDAFFMEAMGKHSRPGFTSSAANYYQKGNIVMSCSVYNDSIKWHIQQAILPGLQVQPGSGGNNPETIITREGYWNPYHNFPGTGAHLVKTYLLHDFEYLWIGGELLSGVSCETRSSNSLEMAYAYPNGAPQRVKKYSALVAFDKGYRYKVEVRVYAVMADRVEAVDALTWIAQHMEVNEDFEQMVL